MESRVLNSVAFFGIFLQLCVVCIARRNWIMEPVSVIVTSSDESKLNMSAVVKRTGRDEHTISGVIEWKFDTDEKTMIEMAIYISNSGSESDYIVLPYKVPQISLNEGINTHYDNFIYKAYGYCSNMPKISGKFKGPFPRNTYRFNRCLPDGHGYPDYIHPAYYRVHFKMIGEVELNLIITVKVTAKLLSRP